MKDIFIVCCSAGVILFILTVIFALALGKAAAPRNAEEQAREDYEQMKALGYFDNTITSGSPVGVENVETKKI